MLGEEIPDDQPRIEVAALLAATPESIEKPHVIAACSLPRVA
jgi:hypothetical protein